jgi:hypothetical protein
MITREELERIVSLTDGRPDAEDVASAHFIASSALDGWSNPAPTALEIVSSPAGDVAEGFGYSLAQLAHDAAYRAAPHDRPRLRHDGEPLQSYRIALGWDKPAAAPAAPAQPTPPASWDQWAMEQAAQFLDQPRYDHQPGKHQNMLHCLLIEAMRFAAPVAEPMGEEEMELLRQTEDEFGDTGETMTPYPKLMEWAARGFLECTHFKFTPAGMRLVLQQDLPTPGMQSK